MRTATRTFSVFPLAMGLTTPGGDPEFPPAEAADAAFLPGPGTLGLERAGERSVLELRGALRFCLGGERSVPPRT